MAKSTGTADRSDPPASKSDRNTLLFETCPLGIFRTTPEGLLLEGNPALKRMFGYDENVEEEVVRDLADDVYADPGRRDELVRRVLESGEAVRTETLYRRRDGTLLVGNVHIWAVRGGQGEVLYIEGIVEDVSEVRLAAEHLSESEERFRSLFENATEAIAVLDDSGRFLDANTAAVELSGYGFDEFIYLNYLDFVPEKFKIEAHEIWKRFRTDGRMSGEFPFACKDGSTKMVEIMAVSDFKPGMHVCFWRDTAQRAHPDYPSPASGDGGPAD